MWHLGSRVGTALLVALAALAGVPAGSSPLASAAASRTLLTTGDAFVQTVTGRGRVVVDARARPCDGFPRMRIFVDGRFDRTVRFGTREYRTFTTQRRYALGTHRVRLVMVADKRTPGCNRRVETRRVRLSEPMPAPGPGDEDGDFTIAVVGDTQRQVLSAGDASFGRAVDWLARRRDDQDIRFAAHTGDITNWGWLAQSQYAIARSAMHRFTAAGIPWQVSVGNHDTRAVGVGGSAYVYSGTSCVDRFGPEECTSRRLLRRTDEFNAAFSTADYIGHTGSWPTGRADNTFSTFRAAGSSWLVLNLELWPRPEAVSWAAQVVEAHPRHNVIVQTHDYLRGSGAVRDDQTNGATAPTYLESHLVRKYDNVKIVLSGHEGRVASSVFTYPGEHKVVAYLGNAPGGLAVVRLIHVDVEAGVVASRFWTRTAEPTMDTARLTYAGGFEFE